MSILSFIRLLTFHLFSVVLEVEFVVEPLLLVCLFADAKVFHFVSSHSIVTLFRWYPFSSFLHRYWVFIYLLDLFIRIDLRNACSLEQ